MQSIYLEEKLLPDIIATGCTNSIKLDEVDFRVPCGKCLPCQKKRRSDWAFRLEQEFLGSDSAFFITLTYNDLTIPRTKEGIPTLFKKDVQDYIKRLRWHHQKYVSKELKIPMKQVKEVSKPIRYYAVGEYGTKTRRPHYHLLLFNYDIANLTPLTAQWKHTQSGVKMGHVDIGTVTNASIEYTTKYMFKPFGKKDLRQKPFSLMSKKPIIGNYYLEQHKGWHQYYEDLTVRNLKGNIQRLPKAFLRRIFPDKEQRLKLSLDSYQTFKDNKIKEFERLLETSYKGDISIYEKSVESDKKRQLQIINTKETL